MYIYIYMYMYIHIYIYPFTYSMVQQADFCEIVPAVPGALRTRETDFSNVYSVVLFYSRF